jgi:hypothetical protein
MIAEDGTVPVAGLPLPNAVGAIQIPRQINLGFDFTKVEVLEEQGNAMHPRVAKRLAKAYTSSRSA